MKLKNNYTYILEFYKQSINSPKFVLIFLLSILISIYGILQVAFGYSYSVGFIRILSFGLYIISILLILLLNTKNIYDIFEKNSFLIIRFKNKEKYLNELIKTVCFGNFCTIIMNVLLVMIGLNLFNENKIIPEFEIYTIQSNYYVVFVILKFIILSLIISVFNVILLKKFNKLIVIILNFILYVLIASVSKGYIFIYSLKQIPLFIGDYYLINFYSNFLFEVCIFLLFMTLMILLIVILKRLNIKNMKDVSL